ncbi:MAG: hypothetical protein ACJ8AW_33200 [Rhodopila sp.]
MNDRAKSEAEDKREILAGLSRALNALSARMQSQQEAALKITTLAVRAENIAERSWQLTASRSQLSQRDVDALVANVKAFAADVADAAKRAGEEALLGREVAQAIAAHVDDITKLARDIDILADAAAVRARLRPLSQTLATVPERMKASADTVKDVNRIADLAGNLAQRSDRLAAGGIAAHREAVALSRDLRHFAEEATSISLEMTRGSAMAVKAINDMTERTVRLSLGKPVPDKPPSAQDRMTILVQEAKPRDEVWVSTTKRRDPDQIKGATVWEATPGGKRQPL